MVVLSPLVFALGAGEKPRLGLVGGADLLHFVASALVAAFGTASARRRTESRRRPRRCRRFPSPPGPCRGDGDLLSAASRAFSNPQLPQTQTPPSVFIIEPHSSQNSIVTTVACRPLNTLRAGDLRLEVSVETNNKIGVSPSQSFRPTSSQASMSSMSSLVDRQYGSMSPSCIT